MGIKEQVKRGFELSFAVARECAGTASEALVISFGGISKPLMKSAKGLKHEMLEAGYAPDVDRTATLLKDDYISLGFGVRDEVSIDGESYRVTEIRDDAPFVHIGLSHIT